MKKFLIISFNFEPNNNPRAIRWNAILNYIKKKNLSVEFITYKKNKKKYSKNINFHEHQNKLFNEFKEKNLKLVQSNYIYNIYKITKIILLKIFKFFYKIIVKHIYGLIMPVLQFILFIKQL